MKNILGLDLGTNSIGWALVKQDFNLKEGQIIGIGSRIIPMSQDILGKFDSGVSISQTAERTGYRGIRKLYQRDNLRRERLHRVLNILGFLPEHYANSIDFEKHLGQFKKGCEPKIDYNKNPQGKFKFLFMDSFLEMVNEFERIGQTIKIPYDWTIYYLRKKALYEKISKEELAWVILNFNQKRGYYQLRGEEEEIDESKQKEFCVLTVQEVIDSGEKVKGKNLYDISFSNGWKYDRQTTKPDDWIGKTIEFIVTSTKTSKGETKRTFKAVDSEKDWIAIKKKSERDIEKSKKTIGEYIFETLKQNPHQKIRGRLIRTIERKYYKDEFRKIIEKQSEFHDELKSNELYNACINELYPRNEAHLSIIKNKDFKYLFLDDIIFYQRPLKSKKSSISSCSYEFRSFKKQIEVKENGRIVSKEKIIKEGINAIPKSHPLFQEFRLWQFLSNIKIYKQTKQGEINFTPQLLPDEDSWVELFDFLNSRKEVEQKNIIDYFTNSVKLIPKSEKENYRWNYVEDKKYPCNETRAQFVTRLKKINTETVLTSEFETGLWHIIYSVKDKAEYVQALKTFATKYKLHIQSFVDVFSSFKPFDSEYGAYSQKAIKKLLPLMRRGKYWSSIDIAEDVKHKATSISERLEYINYDKSKLEENVSDDEIPKQVLKSFIDFKNKSLLSGLNTYQACYLVYGRHSETAENSKWHSPLDIDKYLNDFKQHSLRNPIVEQVISETLRTVRDLWEFYGNGEQNFFNEIHIELGRELKNPAAKRKQIAARNTENENTNQRIRELLIELMNDEKVQGEIRPHSRSHQEILKLYEEGIFQNPSANFETISSDEIEKIRKNSSPNNSEIKRYKLWLEQGYRSPYTGSTIPLSKLFTTDYQIEHIIPQARYFDDSLSNKIICESEVNQLKSNKTAYEFIKSEKGRIVELSNGKTIKLFAIESYEEHCNKYFKRNRTKLNKLLSEDVPEGFIERQMNDSRYISKFVKSLLTNIVREEDEKEATSKNLIPITGSITNKLKQDWGLNDKWNEIVSPRFIRLNDISGSSSFGNWDNDINAFRCTVPDDLKRNFNKKRIDHRHHALDALIIACAQRKHIQYLNSLNNDNDKFELRKNLLLKNKQGDFTKSFLMPWESFASDALVALQKTIVSFKQNLRVINKTNNKTWQWVKQQSGQFKKELQKQTKGNNWAIRKPLHKETVSGYVSIRLKKTVSLVNGIKDWQNLVDKRLKKKINKLYKEGNDEKNVLKYFKDNPYKIDGEKVLKVQVYYFSKDASASRIGLTEKFTRKQLESITDSGIRKILENHLKKYTDDNGKEKFDLAFNPNGIDELNKNIESLNNGRQHQPIYRVRVYEEGSKFNVGYEGNKHTKYVEAAKGTNLFFAVYWNEQKQKREFETIPLNVVIEHQKQVAGLTKEERTAVPLNPDKGKLLFILSPNDLVYVPNEEEIENPGSVRFDKLDKDQVDRIHKMVSCSGIQCFFIQGCIAKSIVNKIEFSALNKMERTIDNIMIKEVCWKIVTDRLGNITKIKR